MNRFTLMTLACVCTQISAEETMNLSEIKFSIDRNHQPFQTPSATSFIEKDEIGRDLNEVLRTSPGLFTQHDIGQGGVSVNLRGLEGAGRVNTTIDGVSQNFYQVNPTHGWNGHAVYINDDFLVGAEVQRGLSQGVSGGNALGGSVNFRTLTPNDLVEEGKTFGSRLTLRHGSNGYGTNGMIASAYKYELDNGGSVGLLSAFGGKVKGSYKNGAGEVIAGDEHSEGVAQKGNANVRNFMAKIEYSPNRHNTFNFNYIGNRSRAVNNHTPIDVASDSAQFQYRYNPFSDKIDLRADISYTNSKQYLEKQDHDNGFQGRTTLNPTWQLSLENRSHFEFDEADFSLNYGIKHQNIRYDVDQSKVENPINSLILSRGTSKTNHLFLEGEWKYKDFEVLGGARYEHYRYGGYIPPIDPRYSYIVPRGGDVHFSQNQKHFNPYVGLSYQPTDWLQLYATYAHTSRAPNVQEFMSGSNNGSSLAYAINPYLKSETARNRDVGFNIFKHGLFREDDIARLKVNYFNNRVKNYIFEERMYLCDDLSKCDVDTYLNGAMEISPLTLYVNHPDVTKIRGWEIEGGYDFGSAFVNLSYTRSTTHMPINLQAEFLGNTQNQPESRFLLDFGTRWLDNDLIIGARMSRFKGDSTSGGTDDDKGLLNRLPNSSPVYDLYVKYQVNKNMKLFFNIENVTNTIYNYPLSRGTLGTGNVGEPDNWANKGTGRGRTFYAGFTIDF